MAGGSELVVFALDGLRLALPLASVRRVVHAVEVTPLPGAPSFIRGMIDVQGEAVAVVDMRARLGLPNRELTPDNQFVLGDSRTRSLALAVDRVEQVIAAPVDELPDAQLAGPGGETLSGLARLPDGLILIQDLDRFLTPQDERGLAAALEAAA